MSIIARFSFRHITDDIAPGAAQAIFKFLQAVKVCPDFLNRNQIKMRNNFLLKFLELNT